MNRRNFMRALSAATFAPFAARVSTKKDEMLTITNSHTGDAQLSTEALSVREFVAEEVRLNVSDGYWCQGGGLLGVDLLLPEEGERVIVWCNRLYGALGEGDYLVLRHFDEEMLRVYDAWLKVEQVHSRDDDHACFTVEYLGGGKERDTIEIGSVLLVHDKRAASFIDMKGLSA